MPSFAKLALGLAAILGLGVLTAAGLRPAIVVHAQPVGAMPVIAVQEVDATSASAYAAVIGEINRMAQAKWQIPALRHVYLGESAGDDSGVVLAVTRAESFAALQALADKVGNDAEMLAARAQLAEIRKLGSNVLYQAVRFDGVHANGASMITKAVLTDEAAYLGALDGLRGLFDANGLKDVKINCYRVAAGRTEWTHMIALNSPSLERRAALLDAVNTTAWAQQWMASVNPIRKVVANGTYREITPAAAK